MTKRALVIGGGGLVGLAWGIGWFDGLSKAEGSLADAERVIGTSIGAAVGAMLDATDRSRIAQMLSLATGVGGGVEQPEALQQLLGAKDASIETRQAIGQAALAADTMPAAQWISVVGMVGGGTERTWPPTLEVVATDAQTGERVVLRDGDCPLTTAQAASAAIPGVLPVVPIGDRWYMDGGIGSATNADLATGADRVLVLRLMPPRVDGTFGNQPERLVEELAEVGGESFVVAPEKLPEGGLMDASLVSPAYTAGYWQGKNAAADVMAFWQA